MEKLIIKFPCNDIEIDEIKSIFSELKDVEVVETDKKHFEAQVISDIIVNSIPQIPAIVLAFLTYRQGVLANKKVDLYDDEGNIIKLKIRIKDINRVMPKKEDESN